MIVYKGYIGAVDFDPEIDLFHGTVIKTKNVIPFYGASVTELRAEMHQSVEGYPEFCGEQGIAPEKPFSGGLPFSTNRPKSIDISPGEATLAVYPAEKLAITWGSLKKPRGL